MPGPPACPNVAWAWQQRPGLPRPDARRADLRGQVRGSQHPVAGCADPIVGSAFGYPAGPICLRPSVLTVSSQRATARPASVSTRLVVREWRVGGLPGTRACAAEHPPGVLGGDWREVAVAAPQRTT